NSTTGTTTNANGEFTLSVPDGTDVELEISMLGYKTINIKPENLANVVVALKEESTTLENFVVIGYGTARRQDFTGSVSSVKLEGSPLAQMPNMSALEAIKGNVSGLSVGATNSAGGEPSILVRGQNSIGDPNNDGTTA